VTGGNVFCCCYDWLDQWLCWFIVTGGNIFVVAMIGWISGDVCFIVTGGNVFCCCYDWLDKG
jgi:hypothetical protein